MKIIVAPTPREVASLAGIVVLNRLLENPRLTLGVAAGETPKGLYREIARAHRALRVDLRGVRVFHLDEYLGAGENHPLSFVRQLRHRLLRRVDIPRENVHFIRGDAKEPAAECARYEEAIRAAGGIDLQVIGIGRNGHVAFNEPGSSFASRTRVVRLTPETRRANGGAAVPGRAITLGLGTILDARSLLLLATGKDKARAIAEAVEGDLDEGCPASCLRIHGDVTAILDTEAASFLTRSGPIVEEEAPLTLFEGKTLPPGRRVAMISPHPDDTSISCGGLLALWSGHSRVTSVVMTNGHHADIPGKSKRERIAIRKSEARREGEILGANVVFPKLAFYDAGNAVIGADASALQKLLRRLDPDVVILPSPTDRHPAHRTCHRITREAVRRLLVRGARRRPIELWHFEGPWRVFERDEFNTVVALGAAAEARKSRAIRAHASQIGRKRYDLAARGLATFRAVTVPESKLSRFGKSLAFPGKTCELYHRIVLRAR
jgi:glucosamine-6-phosphate deaminase